MANTRGLDNAYRVLGSDGKPRPDFRWGNADDPRDPVEVLPEDGVRFEACGFRVLDESELSPGIRAITDREIVHGLHRWPRVCMRRGLDTRRTGPNRSRSVMQSSGRLGLAGR